MPWMWDALACLDIYGVRLTDPKRRTYSGLRDASECWQNIIYVHIAGQPGGEVRRFPILDGLPVHPLRSRALCQKLRALCHFVVSIKVVSFKWDSTLSGASSCCALTQGNETRR